MNIYWDGKSENLRVLLFLIDIYRYLKIFKDVLLFEEALSYAPSQICDIISRKANFANRIQQNNMDKQSKKKYFARQVLTNPAACAKIIPLL